MKNGFKFLGIIAAVAVIGLSTTGCASTSVGRERAWSHQTNIPYKNYVVIGAVVVRNTSEQTVIADLMDAAIEMGGHDIINVRTTSTTTRMFGLRMSHTINSATAVVIRYTEETLMETENSTDVIVNESGVAHTVTTESATYWTGGDDGGGGLFGGGGRGLFGRN